MQGPRRAKKNIPDSMNDMRDRVGGVTASLGDLGNAVKDVFIEKLTDMLRRAVSVGDRGQQAARDAVEEVRDDLEERIEARPYKAILIAAGVGLILGLVLRRR